MQSLLMLLKVGAIAAMVVLGLWLGGGSLHPLPLLDRPVSLGLAGAIGAAMIPIAFAYGGWQTASFVAGESMLRAGNSQSTTAARVILLFADIRVYAIFRLDALSVFSRGQRREARSRSREMP